MKRYIVEFRIEGIFDNYIGDYIKAYTADEALEYAKEWCIERDFDLDIVELIKVIDYETRELLIIE